jgi:hypothetical protein
MSDIDDNMLEDFEEEPLAPAAKAAAPANRNFFIAIAVIGGLFLLSLIGLAVYGAVILPQQSEARRQQAAEINAQNTEVAREATFSAGQVAIIPSVTSAPTEPMVAAASATPVVAFPTATDAPTETPEPLSEEMSGRTETVAALLTQAAGGTVVPIGAGPEDGGSPTALPTAGFADEAGLPGMIGLSLLLVVMIFFVRRLRFANR